MEDQEPNAFVKAMKEIEHIEELYWESLSSEQQLCCFNSVVRRLYKGDIVDKGTYRYVLYNIFGFGPESYARAQMAGYLALHNCVMTSDQEHKLLQEFAKHCGLTEEEADSKVKDFYVKKYL